MSRGLVAGRTGQCAAAHLLELGAGGHLLGEQRGLDAVEEALQPADQLRLRDAQLGVGGRVALAERQRQPFELVEQLRRQALLELLDRAPVDLLEPRPAGLVQRRRPHLVEQLLDHAADPHDLGRPRHQVRDRGAFVSARRWLACWGCGLAVRADDHDARRWVRGAHGAQSP